MLAPPTGAGPIVDARVPVPARYLGTIVQLTIN